MFQQAELDNYKLQVELLQKKLERSEEQRQHMEDKFEKNQKKRNEHEKSMKAKSRIKFEQFLDEQRERNERNKTIVKMLENIDHQASTLATRTERLKIMKLQYELYFAKLLQSHAMRSLQNSPRYSILPISQMQPQQPMVYPTIPVQTANVATIPINPNLQTNNIYQNAENFAQQRIPAMTIVGGANRPNSGIDNWNGMINNNPANQITPISANYLPTGNEFMYRYPNQIEYYNGGQILLNQQIPTAAVAVAPNQYGLPIRSNTVPLMSPSDFHDSLNNPILSMQNNNNNFPNQIHNQQQQQPPRKPNKYSTKNNISEYCERDELESIPDCKFYDQNTPMSDRDQLKLNHFRKLQENFKSNEKPSMHQQKTTSKNQYDFGKTQSDSDRDDDNDEPYKNNPDIFYRKEAISSKQPKTVNKIVTENSNSLPAPQNTNDNSDDTKAIPDDNENNVEKSQPINPRPPIPINPRTEGPKQKLNENDLTLSEFDEIQPQLRQYQRFDKRQSISAQLEKPPVWNFNGLNNPDQFARKEKISIENIENAIYGELINPEKQIHKNYIPVETIKSQVRPEPLNFKEIIERENYQIEKSDINNEKVDIVDNSKPVNKMDLVSPKHQMPNQNLNKNQNQEANLYNETISMPQKQQIDFNKTPNPPPNLQNQQTGFIQTPNVIQNLPVQQNIIRANTPQKEQTITNETPILQQNQKVSEEYPQTQENQYLPEPSTNIQNSNAPTNDSTFDNYNNYQQEPEPTVEYNQPESNVQNYEADLTQSLGQPVALQENLEPNITPTVQNQDGYDSQQYDQNYQYQTDQNYVQQEYTDQNLQQNPDVYPENYIQNENTDYQNYPNQEYQNGYDPSTYDYNYDQQQNYQDPNQQYITEAYDDQNYQPQIGSENYQNYDQQQTGEIIDQSAIVPNTENYIQPTETLEQIPIVENPEINQPPQPNNDEVPADPIVASPVKQPPVKANVKPILSKDKSVDLENKKKKKVNFVDSSETDSSTSAPKPDNVTSNNDESDFDFSSAN